MMRVMPRSGATRDLVPKQVPRSARDGTHPFHSELCKRIGHTLPGRLAVFAQHWPERVALREKHRGCWRRIPSLVGPRSSLERDFIEAAFSLFSVERIWPLVRLPYVEAALRSTLRSGLLFDQDRRWSQ